MIRHRPTGDPRDITWRELAAATPGGVLIALLILAVLVVLGGFAGPVVTP